MKIEYFKISLRNSLDIPKKNERKSGQTHIPHAPTLLENAVYNGWQALVTGNRQISKLKKDVTLRNAEKKIESKFPVDMHIYMVCPSQLQSFTKFCIAVSEELR